MIHVRESGKFVTPLMPAGPRVPREDFQVRAGAAGFDYLIELVRLAAVLTFSGQKNIFLPASGLESAGVFASCAEKNEVRDVAEIESDTTPVRATVNYDPGVKTFPRQPKRSKC